MKGVWELFGLAGVGDKSLDSCHSGANSAPGPNTAAWSCPLEQQNSFWRLHKAAWPPSRKGIRCLRQSVWMLLHPSPFLFPGHMCSVINNTGKPVGSALGSAENVTQLWNGFLQNTRQAPVGCAAPPPALPGALTSVPAMSLETLGKFGISVPFLHPCHDRHMQITRSVCISCAVWVIKKFAEVLREALPPR